MTASNNQELVLGMSNLCIAPWDAAQFGPEEYLQFMEAAGYDHMHGLEVTPLRLPWAVPRAMGELAAAGVVGSLHESWRETTPGDVGRSLLRLHFSEALDEAGIVAAMPRLEDSYTELARLQAASPGNALPLIVHPANQHLDGKLPRQQRETYSRDTFPEVRAQLTIEDVAAHDPEIPRITDPEELADHVEIVFENRGLAVVGDIAHLLAERDGKVFGDEELVTGLLCALRQRGRLPELQIAFRPDYYGQPAELVRAAHGLLRTTPQGRILRAVSQVPSDQPLQVYTEARSSAVAKAVPYIPLSKVHRRITDDARELTAA
jgi:hypothetical protein